MSALNTIITSIIIGAMLWVAARNYKGLVEFLHTFAYAVFRRLAKGDTRSVYAVLAEVFTAYAITAPGDKRGKDEKDQQAMGELLVMESLLPEQRRKALGELKKLWPRLSGYVPTMFYTGTSVHFVIFQNIHAKINEDAWKELGMLIENENLTILNHKVIDGRLKLNLNAYEIIFSDKGEKADGRFMYDLGEEKWQKSKSFFLFAVVPFTILQVLYLPVQLVASVFLLLLILYCKIDRDIKEERKINSMGDKERKINYLRIEQKDFREKANNLRSKAAKCDDEKERNKIVEQAGFYETIANRDEEKIRSLMKEDGGKK